jgi:hypothetical protein
MKVRVATERFESRAEGQHGVVSAGLEPLLLQGENPRKPHSPASRAKRTQQFRAAILSQSGSCRVLLQQHSKAYHVAVVACNILNRSHGTDRSV